MLRQAGKPVVIVIHANHAQEIDAGVIAALALCALSSAALLNQSVLLRDVNDSTDSTGGAVNAAVCCRRVALLPASTRSALPARRISSCRDQRALH